MLNGVKKGRFMDRGGEGNLNMGGKEGSDPHPYPAPQSASAQGSSWKSLEVGRRNRQVLGASGTAAGFIAATYGTGQSAARSKKERNI